MTIRNILHYPDKRLRRIAAPVSNFDAGLRQLVDDMAETMYDAPGIGLAATQIDVHQRVIVIDVSKERDQLKIFINPQIVSQEGEETMEEGCLSVPGVYEAVTRAEKISLTTQDVQGQTIKIDTDGILAVCIQHEIDHLDGKVFVDYLSRLKKHRLQKKLDKQQRLAM